MLHGDKRNDGINDMTEFQEKRAQAKANGDKFFQLDPCVNGHTCMRYTSSGACVECAKAANNERRKDKLGEYAQASKDRRHADKEKYRKYIREYMIAYRKTEKGKAATRKAINKYAKLNSAKNQQEEQTNDE